MQVGIKWTPQRTTPSNAERIREIWLADYADWLECLIASYYSGAFCGRWINSTTFVHLYICTWSSWACDLYVYGSLDTCTWIMIWIWIWMAWQVIRLTAMSAHMNVSNVSFLLLISVGNCWGTLYEVQGGSTWEVRSTLCLGTTFLYLSGPLPT